MSGKYSLQFLAYYLSIKAGVGSPRDWHRAELSREERDIITRMYMRQVEEKQPNWFQARMQFFKIANKVKRVQKMRSVLSIAKAWQTMLTTHGSLAAKLAYDRESVTQIVGKQAKNRYLHEIEIATKKVPLSKKLPLYACSGELEADSMNTSRISVLSRRQADCRSHYAYWKHSDGLNFSRDGGGQAETQFFIDPVRAKLVCGLVRRAGRQTRNGGHIHINCRGDHDIAKRVFDALRYHLSWTRWLVSSQRRNHEWCSVAMTPQEFDRALRVKQAAVSACQFNRLGTVEMRLWGTTTKPSDWLGRAALMQSIARWSEHFNCLAYGVQQITMDTAQTAFPAWFSWARTNTPDALRFVLKSLRSKIRSTRTAELDRRNCMTLMQIWETSSLTCPGFRRRRPATTTTQPAATTVAA